MKPSNILYSDSRGRRRRSAEQIAKLIQDYQDSSLSQVQFCRQHQVPLSSFTHWLRRQRRKAQATPRRSRPTFRQVDLGAVLPRSGWAAEVVRPDGLVVRLSANASPCWVSELLQAC